ncbi:MAG TPA: PCYCGC motif-containing (lipo)protein [Vicinamibacterales bacterium]|nr:PCYCGC motif-containing (lipo)protein [Vicinamibacterales bacterium]
MAPMLSRLHAIALAALLAALPVAAAAGQHEHGAPATAARATAAKAAPVPLKGAVGPLPPLPRVGYAPARPMEVVQQVFEFAARHPEVLSYVPCYCGCENPSLGHKGNHDCFVKSRAASGMVTQWESHGIGCQICIDVGREAMLLFNSGASVTAIRAAIDKKYGAYFGSSTPTPKPPQAPAKKAAPSR